jgi:putative DNA primase/helicase
VTTSETEKGKHLAEQKIKYLTGMGEIKACRKYENPITFKPTFKLFVDANHKPEIDEDDQAMWNRVRAIPFDVTIAAHEIDPELWRKIQREAEGVLAWLVEGCILWQASRPLGTVTQLVNTAATWREEMNPLKAFLEDKCVLRSNSTCPVGILRDAYTAWAKSAREEPMANLHFVRRLESMGLKRSRRKIGGHQMWVWEGIGVTG